MAGRYPSRIKHVQAGEPVDAGVASRPSMALEARTNFLKESIEAIEEGRLLVYKNQTIDPDVLEGQPVFWNYETQRFEQALAAVETDSETGTLVPKASADCMGLCLLKHAGGTSADIALAGVARFRSLANAIDNTILPGRYYLSAAVPGKLVRQRPPATVAVCFVLGPLDACDENTWVFILPQMRDFIEDHIHYRFELEPRPAGTTSPPAPGDCHEIIDADSTLKGWLPADHEVFNDMAPTGAKFGYNLQAHPELERVFPPIPLDAAVMYWDKGQDLLGGTEIPLTGANRLVTVDRNGIWWMSCCEGDVPWPADFDNTGSASSPSSSESSAGLNCPRTERMRIIFAFLHMVFATDKSVVTSLQPDDGQPLEYVNCDGQPANTGDLYSRLKLQALLDDEEYYGGQVLKEIVDPSLLFGPGWVCEGIISGSDEVVLSSTRQRGLDPTEAISEANPAVHQGLVVVSLNLDPAERELPPQIVRLGDAMERMHKNIPYIGFPENRDSGIRLRMNVPTAGLPPNPQVKLRAVLFGRANGTLPPLVASYYRLARPDGTTTPTPLTEGDTVIDFPVSGITATMDEAIEVESEAFDVAAGDTVLVSIEREAGSGYDTAEVGIIRAGGILAAGS